LHQVLAGFGIEFVEAANWLTFRLPPIVKQIEIIIVKRDVAR
jgi:hypothetical protein